MPAADPGLVVLIDDVRSFRDGRPCLVARSSAEGVRLLESVAEKRITELWLDHDLVGDDTIWPVVHFLEATQLDIGLVQVHASRAGPAHDMILSLRRAGYRVRRSFDLRIFTW